MPRKVAGGGTAKGDPGMALGVKSGGISKKPAPEKLKKVMKKGKLPEFTFDTRSIFVSYLPFVLAWRAAPVVDERCRALLARVHRDVDGRY